MPVLLMCLLMIGLGSAQDVTNKTAEYMDAMARVNHYSGVVLIAKNGKSLFAHPYGFADWDQRLPNTLNTKFRIGSITKTFTAAAVLILRDGGKLKLDDPICNYITGCPEAWRPITIKHLLTHSSGIADDFAELTRMRREHKSSAEFIEAIKQHPLSFPPGTRSRYSNSGYILLGGIVAKVSGEPYPSFLRKRIFGPLEMKDTVAETAPVAGEAVGYSWDGTTYQKTELLDVSGLSATAMVTSSVADLLRFTEALHRGKLLKQGTVAEMWTPQIEHSGYAWHINTVNGRKMVSHGGDIEGFASALDYYPDQGVFVASLSNVGRIQPTQLVADLASIAFGEPYAVPHERKFITLSAEEMKALVGTYRLSSGGTICVTAEGNQLMVAPGNGGATACQPESRSSCFLQPIADDVTFVRDSAGAVTGIRMGNQVEGEKKSTTEYEHCPALFLH